MVLVVICDVCDDVRQKSHFLLALYYCLMQIFLRYSARSKKATSRTGSYITKS
jgi:hypothetical protein